MDLSPDMMLALERGTRAKQLLSDDAFTETVNDLTNYHLSALVAAKPTDAERPARDYHHLMQHALTEIVDTLVEQAEVARKIEEMLGEEEEE